MNRILMALCLTLSSVAYGGRIDRALGELECGQETDPGWQQLADFAYQDDAAVHFVKYYASPYQHHFKGSIPVTEIETVDGRVFAVNFFFDFDQPKKYKQSRRIWRWMNQHYGVAVENELFWAWFIDDVDGVIGGLMGSAGDSMGFKLVCSWSE